MPSPTPEKGMTGKRLSLSVKVLVLDDSDRCLLLRRSMVSKGNPGKWDLPGGKVDAGESFDEALLREVEEETGLTVDLHGTVGTAESDLPDRKVVYLVLHGRVTSGEIVLSSEHDEAAWFARARLGAVDVCPQFRDVLGSFARG
jgi:8-oxo-dGTP diphosphatase